MEVAALVELPIAAPRFAPMSVGVAMCCLPLAASPQAPTAQRKSRFSPQMGLPLCIIFLKFVRTKASSRPVS